jgi:hypothetical protein
MEDFEQLAMAVKALRDAKLEMLPQQDENAPRVEVRLSPDARAFLSAMASQCKQDPANVAAFLLDRLVRDPGCIRKLVQPEA